MTDYKHILVAVDFSPAADIVAKAALDVVRRYGASLSLIHVVDYLPPLGFGDDFTPSPTLLIDEHELLEQGRVSLKKFATKLGLETTRQQILAGMPKQEILHAAEEQDIDLIVIGSHGRHGLNRLLGSTARSILNDAPCDVLAVRIKE